jgi:hypothetical protein
MGKIPNLPSLNVHQASPCAGPKFGREFGDALIDGKVVAGC